MPQRPPLLIDDNDPGNDSDADHLDRFWRPADGRLVPLIVQSFDHVNELRSTSTWVRMGKPSSEIPSLQLLSYWILDPILDRETGQRRFTRATVASTLVRLVGASPLTCLVLSGLDFQIGTVGLLWFTISATKESQHYDPAHCGSAAVTTLQACNGGEVTARSANGANSQLASYTLQPRQRTPNIISEPASTASGIDSLTLRPRYLCFIDDAQKKTYQTIRVLDYLQDHGQQSDTEFVFVSYTRLQFRIATDSEIDAYAYPDERTREANRQVARQDRQALVNWGIEAALSAGKRAFWLDFECIRDTDGIARSDSTSHDVYHICDIVRAAHSMIIALGPPTNDKVQCILNGVELPAYSAIQGARWLRQWGSRLWTLPEVLLCPNEYRIKIYSQGDAEEPKSLAKRNFAERAWDDAEAVNELVNHFEGSAILAPMHFLSTALECFARRKTDQFSQGDVAYAIMGLIADRQRPRVNHDDSGFRAFARLSLAFDGGRILEGLTCLSPSRPTATWFDISDYWGSTVKDIYPLCRIIEVAEDDALVVDGLVGATIHWDRMPEATSLDVMPDLALWALSIFLSIGVLSFKFAVQWTTAWEMTDGRGLDKYRDFIKSVNKNSITLTILASVIAPLIFLFSTASPLHRDQLRSRTRQIVTIALSVLPFILFPLLYIIRITIPRQPLQPRLIGIEGTVDAATIERHLWGFRRGKLATTALDDDNTSRGPGAAAGRLPQRHAFTILDTHELRITQFKCSKPPVAMFIAGHEGSMHRALLCSYDWKTHTFHREKAIQVGSSVRGMMHPVKQVRLSWQSAATGVSESHVQEPGIPITDPALANQSDASLNAVRESAANAGHGVWKARFAFLAVALLGMETYGRLNSAIFLPNPAPFYVGLAASQVPSYFLVRNVPIIRSMPYTCVLHGTILLMSVLVYNDFLTMSSWIAMLGVSIGLSLPQLVMYTWSWYPPSQIPVRMFAWTVLPAQLLLLLNMIYLGLDSTTRTAFGIVSIIPALLCHFGVVGSGLLGAPTDVSWLDAPRKMHLVRNAAAAKYQTHRSQMLRPQQQLMGRSRIQATLIATMFLILSSLNGAASTYLDIGLETEGLYLNFESILTVTAVSLVLFLLPGSINLITMACLTIPAIGLHFLSDLHPSLFNILISLQSIVQPLTWSLVTQLTHSWPHAILSLIFSLVGMTAGSAGAVFSALQKEKATVVSAAIMILESVLLVLVSLARVRWQRIAIRKSRASVVRSEYRDDIELEVQ